MKPFRVAQALAVPCAVALVLLAGHSVVQAQSSLPAPWASADIGNVGLAGNSYEYDGDFFVSGAGADIWGTADAFQFAYAPFQGDGDISVTVHGEGDTNFFAKAGVMIRQSLDPASPHVILDINPSGRVEFMTRAAFGGETTLLATSSVPVSTSSNGSNFFFGPGDVKVRLMRSGDTVSGQLSTDGGGSWTMLGSTRLGGPALAGLAVTSHDTSVVNQAYFGYPSVRKVPPPWNSFDFGAVGVPGDAWYANGTFTVSGAGADIWGTADAFRAVFQDYGGDFGLVARVLSEQNTNYFAKAGIMLRADQSVSSATAILDVLPNGTVEFMSRATDGGEMAVVAYDTIALPAWLKLSRSGDQVTAWIGTDPSAMRSIGTATVALTPPASTLIETGLVVTSHDTTQLNTAVFDQVSIVPAAGGNLLVNGGFEQSTPPATGPGWVSDSIRQVPAKSETNQPRSGLKNGACWATDYLDCGMYEELSAPSSGTYTFTIYANADRTGGFVGANVNGTTVAWQAVDVRGFGNYGAAYTMTVTANAGDTIRLWMYSPATPGYVVIDDVSLVLVQ